jgi:hypothetical protein
VQVKTAVLHWVRVLTEATPDSPADGAPAAAAAADEKDGQWVQLDVRIIITIITILG